MIARFFIDRPIFAVVISLVIVLVGGVALFILPITQYPNVTPPAVVVTTVYPGANASTSGTKRKMWDFIKLLLYVAVHY